MFGNQHGGSVARGDEADAGTLRSARLILVPCTPEIARAVLAGPESVLRLFGMRLSGGWPGPNFAAYLPALVADPELGRWVWLVLLPADRVIIGDIGFHGPPDQAGMVALGYVLTLAYRGQGYATEAAQVLLAWTRTQSAVRRLIANCDAGNHASIRVLEKLGLYLRTRDGDELHWEYPRPYPPF